MNPYALLFWLAIIVLLAALAVGIALHKSGSIQLRRRRLEDQNYIEHSDFERALKALRHEFRNSMEAGQTAARKATTIGETVIAALKAIESALRSFNDRLAELEKRIDESDGLLTRLKSSLEKQDNSSKDSAHAIERVNIRLEGFEQQLMAATDQLSSLRQTINDITAQNQQNSETLRTINSTFKAVQAQTDGLSQRLDLKERDQTDLWSLTKSTADSFASLNTASEKIAQRVSDLETRATAIEARTTEEVKDTAENESPISRGGGSREGREITHRREGGERISTPKVQLIAKRGADDWQIFAEVDSVDPAKLHLVQGDNSLQSESDPLQFGPLRDLTTSLQIRCEGAVPIERTLLTEDSPILYFHLHRNFAREARRPSRGLNLAVVPNQWWYDEGKSGAPPIEPEPIGVPGYSIHFFSTDRNPVLTFGRPEGAPFVFECAEPEFRLGGDCLRDAEDEMGPLFGGELPSLEAGPGDLAKVRTIVIGAEGSGPGRWRDKCTLENWQEKVRARGSGWYFVRLYDGLDDLIDSLDFRYVAGLKSIDGGTVDPNQECIHITFVHDENVSVNMRGIGPAQLERSTVGMPPSTVFAWPSDPNVRKATFEVRDGGTPVRVTLNTDRIWWAVVNGSQTTEVVWQSSPINLTPADFAPVSNSELLIRFPRSTTTEAFIGFERSDQRRLAITSAGPATLRLYAFSEVPFFRFGTHKLRLWIIEEEAESELCLANVNVSTKCPWCEIRLSDQEEMLNHVLSQHHPHCFERLTLKGTGVTRAIFVCLVSGCGQYYPESYLPGENPIDRLARHSNALHPDRMAYRKIESPQDIRNLLGLREKWVWKCNLGNCRPITPSADDEDALADKRAHLIQEHFGDLFISVETEN